jgi:pimeloyl-ACP methyl ester carboxylesterase
MPRPLVIRPSALRFRQAALRCLVFALVIASLPLRSAVAQRGPLRRSVVASGDGVGLVVWSKRPAHGVKGSILLLHGRTWSARPNFDLQVPGQRVSLMDAFVRRGYAVYALDQRGYGATPRDSSQWLTPETAAHDAITVLRWIGARRAGHDRPALLGYSQGSLTAMLAAERDRGALSALVLYGFPLDLSDTTLRHASRPAPRLERRATTIAGAEEDFLTPESTPTGVKAAYATAAVASDPVRSDWRDEGTFLSMDPGALHMPVLVLNGERDPYAARAHLGSFLARVTGVDRSWVVLAQADHVAHLERQSAFVDAIVAFLERDHRLR